MRKLILRNFQSPGDIVVMTLVLRALHTAFPGKFQTDVRTSVAAIWENNPWITPLSESDPDVEIIEMHYPMIHNSNTHPYHFIHGFVRYLEQRLGLSIPVTQFAGEIFLTDEERQWPIPGFDLPDQYAVIVAGGKEDITAKWWNPASYQQVVDDHHGILNFVQCGEGGHWHPPLNHVVNLVGQTTLRQFILLIYHAILVICPVTFAMHAAAALATRPGRPRLRPCIVIGGGREPAHWEQYPGHQYLCTVGALSCCLDGGCWRSRCQLIGDGDEKDRRNVCEQPVQLTPELRIARCMHMITPDDVKRRIEYYREGGALSTEILTRPAQATATVLATATHRNGHGIPTQPVPRPRASQPVATRNAIRRPVTVRTPTNGLLKKVTGTLGARITHEVIETPENSRPLLQQTQSVPDAAPSVSSIRMHHGLGDCAYGAHLVPLYTRRGHQIEVECTPDKRLIFEAAGARVLDKPAQVEHPWGYPSGGTSPGHGQFWQGSKIGHNISERPLPNIGRKGDLWNELCASRIDIRPHLSSGVLETARRFLERLPKPVVLFHQKGNTGQARKSLSDAVASAFYESFLDRCDGTLILLDWDQRVPRLASYRVRPLMEIGDCPLDLLLALMTEADLLIGVDSGPLHLSRFTNIPTIGVWQPGHYPTTYTLPRPEQLNVVLTDHTRQWNKFKRIPWNLYEHPGAAFDATQLANLTQRMLSAPRYLQVAERNAHPLGQGPTLAQDVQLQQFVREFCRCRGTSPLARHWDRQRSLDVLFQEIARRFESPQIVETGTIRSEEDFGGAGFFTYVAGTFVHRHGGKVDSVDLNPANVKFAKEWTAVFGDAVSVHREDSVAFLTTFAKSIDVLYLDSLDTDDPHHAAHCQRELEAALPRLHERSLICIDDTPWQEGAFTGKGATAIPWLLNHGWRILYAGYQVVLERGNEKTG